MCESALPEKESLGVIAKRNEQMIKNTMKTSTNPLLKNTRATILAVALLSALGLSAQEIEWIRQFGAAGPAFEFASAVDADGNIYVTGLTDGTLPGQTSVGEVDAFVRKYDAEGNELWTRQFGTSSFDVAFGVAADAGGVYVAGRTFGTLPGQTSAGLHDAFVRKYDSEGNELWTRQFGSSSTDTASGVAADVGGVYVAGSSEGTLPGQTSAGSTDVFVRKYDAEGNELWTRQFGTSSSDLALGVAADAGGVYVAGWTGGTLLGQTSAGDYDAFVRKYDSEGNELWTRQFGTSSSDGSRGVAADAGGVYVSFPGRLAPAARTLFCANMTPQATNFGPGSLGQLPLKPFLLWRWMPAAFTWWEVVEPFPARPLLEALTPLCASMTPKATSSGPGSLGAAPLIARSARLYTPECCM